MSFKKFWKEVAPRVQATVLATFAGCPEVVDAKKLEAEVMAELQNNWFRIRTRRVAVQRAYAERVAGTMSRGLRRRRRDETFKLYYPTALSEVEIQVARVLRDWRSDVPDVVSQAMLNLWIHWDSIPEEPGKRRAYVITTAKRTSYSHIRAANRRARRLENYGVACTVCDAGCVEAPTVTTNLSCRVPEECEVHAVAIALAGVTGDGDGLAAPPRAIVEFVECRVREVVEWIDARAARNRRFPRERLLQTLVMGLQAIQQLAIAEHFQCSASMVCHYVEFLIELFLDEDPPPDKPLRPGRNAHTQPAAREPRAHGRPPEQPLAPTSALEVFMLTIELIHECLDASEREDVLKDLGLEVHDSISGELVRLASSAATRDAAPPVQRARVDNGPLEFEECEIFEEWLEEWLEEHLWSPLFISCDAETAPSWCGSHVSIEDHGHQCDPSDDLPLWECTDDCESGTAMPHDCANTILAKRYHLCRSIGVGAMATVYQAIDLVFNKPVAVKILNPQNACQPEYLSRFYQEAREAALSQHEHLVEVIDQGMSDGIAYFVMDLLHSELLHSEILTCHLHPSDDECRLARWPTAMEISAQMTAALQRVHSHRVLHRDIKPASCFLGNCPDHLIELRDLRIATVLQESSDQSDPHPAWHTQGPDTPVYCSLEQVMSESIERISNVYLLEVMDLPPDIHDLDALVAAGMAAGGNPEGSVLCQKADIGTMPKRAPPLDDDDEATLNSWIRTCTVPQDPPPGPPQRVGQNPFISLEMMLSEMLGGINNDNDLELEDQPFIRFLTLTHLGYAGNFDDQLDLPPHFLAKLLNSLSAPEKIILPQSFDHERTIYRFDLRDYGWDKDIRAMLFVENEFAVRCTDSKATQLQHLPDTAVPFQWGDRFTTDASEALYAWGPAPARILATRTDDVGQDGDPGLLVHSTALAWCRLGEGKSPTRPLPEEAREIRTSDENPPLNTPLDAHPCVTLGAFLVNYEGQQPLERTPFHFTYTMRKGICAQRRIQDNQHMRRTRWPRRVHAQDAARSLLKGLRQDDPIHRQARWTSPPFDRTLPSAHPDHIRSTTMPPLRPGRPLRAKKPKTTWRHRRTTALSAVHPHAQRP